MSYALWRTLRRPFRFPQCSACVWECFDACHAGCLRCGAHHFCASNAVDNKCPLVLCDDKSRVCSLTGLVLQEVRHGDDEYLDTVTYRSNTVEVSDVEGTVYSTVHFLMSSACSRECITQENNKTVKRLNNLFYKHLKAYKTQHPRTLPSLCHILTLTMNQLSNVRFMERASTQLVDITYQMVASCIINLNHNGVKTNSKERIRETVTGLLYLFRTGLVYNNQVLLPSIPELTRCLPCENKLEFYFKISSKVVTSVENMIKLALRDRIQ
jgi:hypothetical protein